jgi:hypothetical protein
MRSSVVDKVGGQRPLAHTHDMEMWLRISAVSDVAYVHGADQAWHREHARSLSAREVDAHKDLLERHLAFDTLFSWLESDHPDEAALRILAMRAVAASGLELASRIYDRGLPEAEADKFVASVSGMVPDITVVSGWRSLQRRKELGPVRASRHPLSVISRLRRRATNTMAWYRWHRTGVF